MAPVGQVLGREMFSKTKMCKFHRAGKCTKGLQCPWAHDASELNAAPDLRRTKLCKELLTKGICTNEDCNFAHCKEEFRSLDNVADFVTHDVTNLLQPSPFAAEMNTACKPVDEEQTAAMKMPDIAPSLLSADAPDFIPMSFTTEVPAFVPMPSPPPGLEGYVPYSSAWGYESFDREESGSDISSNGDIKIDGNTPIADILALSLPPKHMSSNRRLAATRFASVSTAESLVDLSFLDEEAQFN